MITIKRYASYKDSGVEWLGEIPEAWETYPMIALAKPKSVTGYANKQLLSVYLNLGVIRFSDVSEKRTNVTSLDLSNYQLVEIGDFVLNNQQAWRGSVGVSELCGIVSPAYIVLGLSNKLSSSFANYYFRNNTMVSRYVVSSKGVGTIQRNLYWDYLKRVYISVPPLPEQTAIANYLDEKTAKIDQAINLKTQLIERLKERKQIIIQNAVTKGLNPDVPMKDSGVEWLGDIPAHWEVNRLKFLLSKKLQYGANEAGVEYSKYLPRYIRITDFGSNGELSENNKLSLTYDQSKGYMLEDGDILFARSGATVGKAYHFKIKNTSLQYAFAGYLIKASSNKEKILNDYLYLYAISSIFSSWKSFVFNKATIENIGADKYANLLVVVPPIIEQKDILKSLKEKTDKIDHAITQQQTQIENLKEYKATLIDSAVTGKIKV